jgi:ATP-dependent 26S proteasome regulatory subunit
MDDPTLQSLEEAYRASPDNLQLLAVILQALLDRGNFEKAYSLIGNLEPSQLETPAHRVLVSRVCLEANDPEKALLFAGDEDPQELILRARAFLDLERLEEGRDVYGKAVAANPTLEDPQLANLLSAKIRVFAHPGEPEDGKSRKLRVFSNDDTDESEIQRLLMPEEGEVAFDSVGGLDDIKNTIRKRIILPFQKPSLFARFKKKVGGGILLYGPPGCGKTLLARATAGECKAKFFNVTISDILDMWIGESERKLHAIFELARKSIPAVLFFDELEGLGGKRQYTREATSSKLVSLFLSELDGFVQKNDGVLVLAATNVPWAIDPAFRRPGRFDRVLFVPPPDRDARLQILQIVLQGRPVEGDLGLDSIARQTSGFSGADLENLAETAVDSAIEASLEREVEVPVTAKHLKLAVKEVKQTTMEWLTTARNYARYANEAGHYDEVLEFLTKHRK